MAKNPLPEIDKLRYDNEDLKRQVTEHKRDLALARARLEELGGLGSAAGELSNAVGDLRVVLVKVIALAKDLERALQNRTVGIDDQKLLSRIAAAKLELSEVLR